MKLKDIQIQIKNKEHYEAVKKRLQELGKWNWTNLNDVDNQVEKRDYKRIICSNGSTLYWNENSIHKSITLEDLYEVEKEKVIIERFKVLDEGMIILEDVSTHEEAMDFIKKQDDGAYEIKKYYEVAEE